MISLDERRRRRREAFIDAAENRLCERPFENISVADIVRRSGGSARTFYKLFGGKVGLLQAMIQTRQRWPEIRPGDYAEIQPAQALMEIRLALCHAPGSGNRYNWTPRRTG